MKRIAFFGAGRMASAMVNGILKDNVYSASEIILTSAPDGTGESLADKTGARLTYDVAELLAEVEIVVLAVKPQQIASLPSAAAELMRGKLIISIMAGITLQKIKAMFPGASNIVRSMPNTPGQIGEGVTAYASIETLPGDEKDKVEKILGSLGIVISMDEKQLDAVTGLSGSGPAYVFEFIAALRDGGIAAGLSPDISLKLAQSTVLGAASLQIQSGESPESLRKAVSSPGGTTLAGLAIMEQRKFREMLKDTVVAARDRSIELSQSDS